jgi:acetyl-CoA acetyltransferase
MPVFNVNNNCSTGSTAIVLARQAIEAGAARCVLVVGFEQMQRNPSGTPYGDRPHPIARHAEMVARLQGQSDAPFAAQMFGGAAREYQRTRGVESKTFAKIAEKARRHAAHNPHAVYRDAMSVDEVMASRPIFEPLTKLMCCPPTSGAAAVVLTSDEFARKRDATRPVYIAAQAMTTDTASSFGDSLIQMVGYDMARAAAERVYEQAGLGPRDVDVVELHDCFASNELMSYEALGLCRLGEAEKLVCDGDNTYGGRWVINPSGGLLSKGHPLGATGVAQCVELVWQLRGEAAERQVSGARVALQHNLGLGGACVVTLYRRA